MSCLSTESPSTSFSTVFAVSREVDIWFGNEGSSS